MSDDTSSTEVEEFPRQLENAGRFTVQDRLFTWSAEDGKQVVIPLRVELATLLEFEEQPLTRKVLFDLLSLVGGEDLVDVFRSMDAKDFSDMASTWREVYFDGVSPGKSSASPS